MKDGKTKEVRLPGPVKASYVALQAGQDDLWDTGEPGKIAGAFTTWKSEKDQVYFQFRCPCGCGSSYSLPVGIGHKPNKGPSWEYNGKTESPTLHPSVHLIGHWHGWLRDGKWLQA